MNYQKIELWKNRGFINEDYSIDKQIELSNNLALSKDLLNCHNVLNNYDQDFYLEVESVLYPIVVHYTLIKKNVVNIWETIKKLIEFCENFLRVKYFTEKYNDDYLLCQDFIKIN